MNRDLDCRGFAEALERWDGTSPDPDLLQALRRHAAGCPDCAMLWRLHEHVGFAAERDLAAEAPPELVAGMWTRVATAAGLAAVRETPLAPSAPPPVRHRPWYARRWLTPALAATLAAALFLGGFLAGENRQLRRRQQDLVEQLERQRGLAVELRAGVPAGTRTIDPTPVAILLPGSGLDLARGEAVTAAELRAVLRRLPPQTRVLDARRATDLRRTSWLRPAAWTGIRIEDGLQAGELLQLFEALDLDPQTRITRGRLARLAGDSREF